MLNQFAKEPVARLAARQFGRVSWGQLVALGVDRRTIHDWTTTAYLHRLLPGVYAVGHPAKTTEADLMAAVLYAGPGAMLSHATAAWWVGLADSKPYMIDVSTPRRCRSLPGIRVHGRRSIEHSWHNGLPVTLFPQTMVDYATRARLTDIRRALAKADFDGGLNVTAIEAELRRGSRGSRKLRLAFLDHQPELARANSGLEVVFFELCESHGLPLPELNARIAGWDVDALFREHRVAVELDAPPNHSRPAQVRRDRRKELALRAAQLFILRYSDDQVKNQAAAVITEVREVLTRAERPA